MPAIAHRSGSFLWLVPSKSRKRVLKITNPLFKVTQRYSKFNHKVYKVHTKSTKT